MRRPDVVGTVTSEGFVLQRIRPATPVLPILARGQFRPTPDGTAVEVTLGPSETHISLLVMGILFAAVLLGVVGVLFVVARPAISFNATRVLPAITPLLLVLILVRTWRAASDEERAR